MTDSKDRRHPEHDDDLLPPAGSADLPEIPEAPGPSGEPEDDPLFEEAQALLQPEPGGIADDENEDDPWGQSDTDLAASEPAGEADDAFHDGLAQEPHGEGDHDLEDLGADSADFDLAEDGASERQSTEKQKKQKKLILVAGAGVVVLVVAAAGVLTMVGSPSDRYAIVDEPDLYPTPASTPPPAPLAANEPAPEFEGAPGELGAPTAMEVEPLASLEQDEAIIERLDDFELQLERVAELMITQQETLNTLGERLDQTEASVALLDQAHKAEAAEPEKAQSNAPDKAAKANTAANTKTKGAESGRSSGGAKPASAKAKSKPKAEPKPQTKPTPRRAPASQTLAGLWIKGTFPAAGGPAQMAWIMNDEGTITNVVRVGDIIDGARVTAISERAVNTTQGTILPR